MNSISAAAPIGRTIAKTASRRRIAVDVIEITIGDRL